MTLNADPKAVIDAARYMLDVWEYDNHDDRERLSESLDEAVERLRDAVWRAHHVSCGCKVCLPRNDRSGP